ncbi:hypothetical protein O0L34_g13927 [Tuta absoluta]|nr:hypothetical protein O0L34_g13927 [Tuta absoluta]
MAVSIEHWILVCVTLIVSSCKGHPTPGPGLFDLFSGDDSNQEQGRSMQSNFPSIIPNNFHLLNHMSDYDDSNQQPNNNQPANINLVSLFPQNNAPVTRTGLDPETKQTLSEQKEKLEEVLQKLQEMNKQKEAQRQQQGNGNFNNNPNLDRPAINNGNFNNPNINRPFLNNGNNKFNQGLNRPTPNPIRPGTVSPATERILPTEGPAVGPKRVWKKLMTKKYMFQAKPVKPENEVSTLNVPETLYYVAE